LCRGIQHGRFPQLSDRDNLWRLLIVVAARKTIDYVQHERRAKRGGGRVRAESLLPGDEILACPNDLQHVVGAQPTHEFAALVADEHEALLGCLDDDIARQVAQRKFEGYTNEEIAQHLNCSTRTVQRKLWVIRSKYLEQVAGDE
jgi:DNA-directed RNA polymerase specialized sigma24 family protein